MTIREISMDDTEVKAGSQLLDLFHKQQKYKDMRTVM